VTTYSSALCAPIVRRVVAQHSLSQTAMSDSMDDDQQQGGGGGGGRPKVVITTRHAREAAAAASGGAAGGASSSGGADGSSRQTKGRGFQSRYSDDSSAAPQGRYSGRGGEFESIDAHSGGSDAQKCQFPQDITRPAAVHLVTIRAVRALLRADQRC
jgi:hypothetical protein